MKQEGGGGRMCELRFGKLVRYMYCKATAPPAGLVVRLIFRDAGSIFAGIMRLGYFTHPLTSPMWP